MSRAITYKQGIARSANESAYPKLWKDLAGAWSPVLGPTGLTLFDVSGNNNHGTLTNMSADLDWTAGEKGYQLDFVGTDDFIQFEASSATKVLEVTTGDFSGFMWIKTTNIARAVLFGKRDVGDQGYRFYQFDGDQLELLLDDGPVVSFYSDSFTLSDGNWHFIGFSADRDGDVTFYADGKVVGTQDISGSSGSLHPASPTPLRISGKPNDTQNFPGSISELLFYNRTVSPREDVKLFVIGPGGIFTRKRRVTYSTLGAPAATTQRVRNSAPVFNNHPFTGSGTSLYASQTSTVQYRNQKILSLRKNKKRRRIWVKGSGGNHDIANSVTKTPRQTSVADPTASIPWVFPRSWRLDLFTEDEFQGRLTTWRFSMASPGYRDVWMRTRERFAPSFRAEIDRIVPDVDGYAG